MVRVRGSAWCAPRSGSSRESSTTRYGTEVQFHDALVKMPWPDGFVCPRCRSKSHNLSPAPVLGVPDTGGGQFRYHLSRIKTLLTNRFMSMHLIASAKNEMAGLALARRLADEAEVDGGHANRDRLLTTDMSQKLMTAILARTRQPPSLMGDCSP